ncbi:MAG: peptidoglycan editing factor PgeF [Fibrobacteres bacterium]|nr:peptidoglycan editing factor PgeF [Fibrobacterota bacterium]
MKITTTFRNALWDSFSLSYGFSTAYDSTGDSHTNDVSKFMKQFGAEGEVILLDQVHGDKIIQVNERFNTTVLQQADGLITNVPGKILTIKTADCVPVLLYDPVNKAIAAVHSGWRGTKDLIAVKALSFMNKAYDTNPSDTHVILGPAIKTCCYEVKDDTASYFNKYPDSLETRNGSMYLNVKLPIIKDLKDAGVNSIQNIDSCTGCSGESLCSWRMHKTRKRQYACISL